MADTLRIKRRAAGGAAGAPNALAAAEIAFNEQDNTLYYGRGNNAGQAVTIIPIAGDAKVNEAPSDGQSYNRKNATWVVDAGGGGASITIADTAPAGTHGAMWWESDTGIMWIYYNDGNSSQWVQVNGASAGAVPYSYVDSQDALRVAKTGDTMSGSLIITTDAPYVSLNKTGSASTNTLFGRMNGKPRWAIMPGDDGVETGSNVGSDLIIRRYNDAGSLLGTPLTISRATGQITTPLPILPVTSWTAAQQTSTRKSVYAAPFDALAYNGLIVNGGFDIAQEFPNDQVGVTTSQYVGDVHQWFRGGGTYTLGRVNGGSVGVARVFSAIATTAAPAPAVADLTGLQLWVEGYRTLRLNWGGRAYPQPLTISFWAYSTVGGVISMAVRNFGSTRSYVVPITLVANTWSYQNITVLVDYGGTWSIDNNVGFSLCFTLVAHPSGTFTTSTANAWLTGNWVAHSSQTNVFSATNATVYIGGVTAFAGSAGPAIDQVMNAMRDTIQELPLVQRYYEKVGGRALMWSGYSQGGSAYGATNQFKVTKRIVPTMTYADVQMGNFAALPFAGTTITVDGIEVERTASATQAYNYFITNWTADARF